MLFFTLVVLVLTGSALGQNGVGPADNSTIDLSQFENITGIIYCLFLSNCMAASLTFLDIRKKLFKNITVYWFTLQVKEIGILKSILKSFSKNAFKTKTEKNLCISQNVHRVVSPTTTWDVGKIAVGDTT